MISSVNNTKHWSTSFSVEAGNKTLSIAITLWDKINDDYRIKNLSADCYGLAVNIYEKLSNAVTAAESGKSAVSPISVWDEQIGALYIPAGMFNFSRISSGCQNMPADEYEKHCAEMARTVLIALNMEMPPESELFDIITEAIGRIEDKLIMSIETEKNK